MIGKGRNKVWQFNVAVTLPATRVIKKMMRIETAVIKFGCPGKNSNDGPKVFLRETFHSDYMLVMVPFLHIPG